MENSNRPSASGWLTFEIWMIAVAVIVVGGFVADLLVILPTFLHSHDFASAASSVSHASGWEWTLLSTASEAVFGLAAAIALRTTIHRWWTGGQWRWGQWLWGLALGLALALALVLVNGLWETLQHHSIPSDGGFILNPVAHHPAALIGMLVMISVFGPVMEEWLFRGTLQPSLSAVWGPFWGVLVVALVFAGAHELDAPNPLLHPWIWVPLFPLALVLGYLRTRTGRMSANIGTHMGFNLFSAIVIAVQMWH